MPPDRPALERLVRYMLSPLISADRLTARPDGRVEYHFRRPDPSGRTSWVTDGTTWCRSGAARDREGHAQQHIAKLRRVRRFENPHRPAYPPRTAAIRDAMEQAPFRTASSRLADTQDLVDHHAVHSDRRYEVGSWQVVRAKLATALQKARQPTKDESAGPRRELVIVERSVRL